MRTSTSNECQLHCSIDIIDLNCYANEYSTVLLDFLSCKVLRTLQFKGFIGPLSPSAEISPNLTHLLLHKSCLKQDSMPILEKLPSLGTLVLNDDAYMGKEMVCSASGFPQLKCLRLLNLSELQRIQVENTAMPILSDIEINNCQKLDINSIPTLPRTTYHRVVLTLFHPRRFLLMKYIATPAFSTMITQFFLKTNPPP
uniref:Putative ovule protein n=1 Tax=Solanum chacoense TaxID=4108 RepID=A0A0V0H0Z6_SOLCH